MSLKDANGYGIVEGCYVKVHPKPLKPWRGWVHEVDEKGLVWVVCERRGGVPRPVRYQEVTVLKPSTIDEARRVGNENSVRAVTERAHRARRLQRKEKP